LPEEAVVSRVARVTDRAVRGTAAVAVHLRSRDETLASAAGVGREGQQQRRQRWCAKRSQRRHRPRRAVSCSAFFSHGNSAVRTARARAPSLRTPPFIGGPFNALIDEAASIHAPEQFVHPRAVAILTTRIME